MRRPVVAANWKMHKSLAETERYAERFKDHGVDTVAVEVVLAPPFTALRTLVEALVGSAIAVSGQDLHWEPEGAFTGEISAAMLKDSGASHVIIGHSERRHIFGETNDEVGRKVEAALASELTPIVCVGETLAQRDAEQTLEVLTDQLQTALTGVGAVAARRVIVAYEPVWAIGTGRHATPVQAQDAHRHLRSEVASRFGGDVANQCRIIYGGSVKPDNIAALAAQDDVDGALVGGAGLDPTSFAEIVAKSRAGTV